MAELHSSAVVNAPAEQVYRLFSHFNDFPKFMSSVKEVTYLDDQRSHWVVHYFGTHEWDAVNENWMEGRQIGWRSIGGLRNTGRVTFEPVAPNQTRVDVHIEYDPPAGVLGGAAEAMGAGGGLQAAVQGDLDHFARMVAAAAPGALDPTSSSYLFHSDSAAVKGQTTEAQDETMKDEADRAA